MTWAFAAATCTACCIVVAMAAEGPEVLHEFTLKEHFGVNHADQVVTLELQKKADPGQCRLLDVAGQEVPFEMVEGGFHGSVAFCMELHHHVHAGTRAALGPDRDLEGNRIKADRPLLDERVVR